MTEQHKFVDRFSGPAWYRAWYLEHGWDDGSDTNDTPDWVAMVCDKTGERVVVYGHDEADERRPREWLEQQIDDQARTIEALSAKLVTDQ